MNMPYFRMIRTIRDDFLRGSLRSAISQLLPSESGLSDSPSVISALEQMVLRETLLAETKNRSLNYVSTMMQEEVSTKTQSQIATVDFPRATLRESPTLKQPLKRLFDAVELHPHFNTCPRATRRSWDITDRRGRMSCFLSMNLVFSSPALRSTRANVARLARLQGGGRWTTLGMTTALDL